MSGAPTLVKKGRIIRKIDKRLKAPRREFLDELVKMSATDRLSDLAIKNAHGTIDNSDKPHVDIEWFGIDDGWWPTLKDKEKKIRWAYIQALKIAVSYAQPRPIRTFWLAGVPDVFQCYVHDTRSETGGVMVFWVTPAVPKKGDADSMETPKSKEVPEEDLWVVAGAKEIAAIRKKFPKSYVTAEPEEVEKGIFLFKSTGY
jgi:hypothetical protein